MTPEVTCGDPDNEGSDGFLPRMLLLPKSSSPKALPPVPIYRDPGRDTTEEFSDLDCLQKSLFRANLQSSEPSWSPSITLPDRFLFGRLDRDTLEDDGEREVANVDPDKGLFLLSPFIEDE